MNANTVNASLPNYQTCVMDGEGDSFKVLKKDWQDPQYYESMPTMSGDSLFACVVFQEVSVIGVAICPTNVTGLTESVLRDRCKIIAGATAPAWSPDGKWIAYIPKEMSKQAIYITNRELSENYLVFKPALGQTLQTYPLSWSPDSKWITFATNDGAIWIVDITGNGLKQIVGPGLNGAPAWSQK
jgi:roadblock/LC7 domain-containing protein